VIFEAAYLMGLIPVVWLGWCRVRGRPVGAEWWWLAGAYGVSVLADTASRFLPVEARWVVSLVYPVSQSAVIGAVLLDRRDAMTLVVVLVVIALAAALVEHVHGPDVLVRTVAWGAVVGIAYDRPALGSLRRALLVSFGLGWVAWLAYAAWPGWSSWGAYQFVRLAGLLLFAAACCASPHWKVVR
jgi:hypothetical protein